MVSVSSSEAVGLAYSQQGCEGHVVREEGKKKGLEERVSE
jgi:hypothetical protein